MFTSNKKFSNLKNIASLSDSKQASSLRLGCQSESQKLYSNPYEPEDVQSLPQYETICKFGQINRFGIDKRVAFPSRAGYNNSEDKNNQSNQESNSEENSQSYDSNVKMIVIPEPVYGLYQQSTSIDTYIDFEKLSDQSETSSGQK